MYEDVLVPFDGSEGAAEVLHHASEIAHWADSTIHVLYVADTNRDSVTVVEGQTVDALAQEGEDMVEEATKTLDSLGVPSETDVVQGDPAPTIVEYAERYDYDLVVMPTHGREGLSRYLIGSVSEKVVRLSSVPVLTVRMQPDEQLTFPYEDILIPTDGSTAATHAAEHLVELAAALDATVHVLSVVDDSALGPDVRSTVSGEESEQAATDAVETVVSDAETHGVTDTVRHIEHGTPAEEILDCIESNDIHAVGMGTTGKRGTDRILLGSVAEKTVRSAPVPVMTVTKPE
ncbi:universal stress protein [Halobacterium salinarum]|jgi:nucleotide-binding universal stress UspA family protein|uniref:universal stress protein n=1 Tax=Halobacterium salinarum TaxID=2242 RepID=UPI001F3207F0|nr:universal stress protein [Halobacterium salinarum]MCF2165365.1 universal stress protein [Halobacterium salinarum]MCF2168224.1 universal stress protein [Halobacterium salinarum]MCF2206886.1 universal stress protein [Halobacterium salinarum]MCF2237613.1 universal stress protein [Halobacterium salinarum]MCF2239944.1 universal stress protein [Halobacterium salinarum]